MSHEFTVLGERLIGKELMYCREESERLEHDLLDEAFDAMFVCFD